MTPIQQLMLGVGGAKKTYIDDLFSTFLYKGSSASASGSGQTITNGLDLAGEGGLVWLKDRGGNNENALTDTVTGAGKRLQSESGGAQGTGTESVASFTSSGFTLADGWNPMVNSSSANYASWSFRKKPGFFDIVTWTGNGQDSHQIAHNLGSVPGCILIKCTSITRDWQVYHRDVGNTHALKLNSSNGIDSSSYYWYNTDPTSTHFTVGIAYDSNKNEEEYVAYVFAGGESTAATANSVDFNGSGYLILPASTDLDPGSGDFTIETWFKLDGTGSYYRLFAKGFGQQLQINSNKFKGFFNSVDNSDSGYDVTLESTTTIKTGQWYHGAVTRSGNTFRLFLNGVEEHSVTASFTVATTSYSNLLGSGDYGSISSSFDGLLSNFRYVKGTAVYTSSFRPPTEPLTNITNTKLLCCNHATDEKGSTVTPGTIYSTSGVDPKTDSPFDDSAAYVFGENEDQNVIKCGSYIGNGNTNGPEINVGFEPQWIMIKRAVDGQSGNWATFDCMRGIVTGGNDSYLYPSLTNAEYTSADQMELTPTGFIMKNSGTISNGNLSKYIYVAIRRPDGYCGKPAELGTDVFTMVAGTATVPNYISNGVRDFGIFRTPASSEGWNNFSRLTQNTNIFLNVTTDEASSFSAHQADFNNGMVEVSGDVSAYQSWMWKRHAGFDQVAYSGNSVQGRPIPHNLGVAPEMIWVKCRFGSDNWVVAHKGLDGGNAPFTHYLYLNTADAEGDDTYWDDTAPTSTHFYVSSGSKNNASGDKYISMLFASVDGISKVGYFDGSSSAQTITTGFQPRFLILKNITDGSSGWIVLDTIRGWGSGNDYALNIQSSEAQNNFDDIGAPTSTGFTVSTANAQYNAANKKYIYYAHA